jgi:hypothetical protein
MGDQALTTLPDDPRGYLVDKFGYLWWGPHRRNFDDCRWEVYGRLDRVTATIKNGQLTFKHRWGWEVQIPPEAHAEPIPKELEEKTVKLFEIEAEKELRVTTSP